MKTLYGCLIGVGVVFLILDVIIVIWFLIRRYKKANEKQDEAKHSLIIKQDPWLRKPFKSVKYSPAIFEIPLNIASKEEKANPVNFDIERYDHFKPSKQTMTLPKLAFELFYYFRTSEVQVILKQGKHLPISDDGQIVVSILLSNCSFIHYSNRADAPDPSFNEEFRFPLDSSVISQDPPVQLKFNVWTVDRYSKKNPFGFIQVSVEEIFVKYGLMPVPGKAIVWRNIAKSANLKDDYAPPQLYIHLTYLSAARRISVLLSQIKNLRLEPTDKYVQAKICLKHRDREKRSHWSKYLLCESTLHWNEEFVFNLSEFHHIGIDGVSVIITVQSCAARIFPKYKVLGYVVVGNSVHANEKGRAHWLQMMRSPASSSKWHVLEENKS